MKIYFKISLRIHFIFRCGFCNNAFDPTRGLVSAKQFHFDRCAKFANIQERIWPEDKVQLFLADNNYNQRDSDCPFCEIGPHFSDQVMLRLHFGK